MNDLQTRKYIEEINQYGSILGLDNIRNLLTYLHNPQNELQFIHIAGTNGKGSTLAYISTILKCAGYKVGRYISPTVFDYREKIQMNGKMISKKDLNLYLTKIKSVIAQMLEDGLTHPTAFEIETALSFLYFKDKKCDIVVLETGLGGLLDATNVIETTLVAVLTSISRDHMAYLGDNLTEIAENKAGIIKKGCRVISCDQEREVLDVIRGVCEEKEAILRMGSMSNVEKIKYGLKKQSFQYKEWKKLEITMLGTYQIQNAVLALEVIRTMRELNFKISEKSIYKGLIETQWIGRFSIIASRPTFIIDGAHNENAAKQLADSIRFYFTNKKIIYIMGIFKDKEYDKMIQETYSYAEHVVAVTIPNNHRAMPAYELAQEIHHYHNKVTVADSLQEAVEISYLLADKDSIIIAFGSLSYLGELTAIVKNRDNIRRDNHGKSE